MKAMTLPRGWVWQATVAASAVAMALAIGSAMVWADPPAAPAPAAAAPAVTPANHAAAVEAFKKARDLFQQAENLNGIAAAQKVTEAAAENDRALQLDPNLDEAKLLQRIIAEKKGQGPAPTEGPTTTAGGGTEKVRLLKPEEINLLRVYEWSSSDKQARGHIDRKTLEDFWEQVAKKQGDATREAHDAFLNPANFKDQVEKIKDSGDPAFMSKVTFTTDPEVLVAYKTTIQPFVLQNCATAQCHGGDKAGSFRLIRANGGNDPSSYTNFYILATYANKDGKMIDRNEPDQSLLLQYALAKAVAAHPHPKVEIHPRFADKNDPLFQSVGEWIKSLAFPQPNYGIVYELPGSAPPATAPGGPGKAPK